LEKSIVRQLYTMVKAATAFVSVISAISASAQTMDTASSGSSANGIASPTNIATNSSRLVPRGIPTGRPVSKQTLTPAAFTTLLQSASPSLLQLAGTPKCTVSIYSLGYHTIGGHGEPTTATTAVMVPSGHAAGCSGPHPVVEIAHGTSVDRNYDLSSLTGDINGQNEGLSSAAIFAAQGYTTVIPNFAGYGGSPLPYAPFLNGDQQSADMIDALRAARIAVPQVLLDSALGKFFVTGYSAGGYVAMATMREMQKLPIEFHLAAGGFGSGPYALSHLFDKEIDGEVSALAPLLFDLIVNSYQNSYGNVYREPADTFAAQYAQAAPTLFPGTVPQNTLFAENVIPEFALFQTGSLPPPDVSNPDTALVAQAGFDPKNFFLSTNFREQLVADVAANPCSDATTGQRIANCAPATGLRQDALRNDLLDFKPRVPVQLCGAHSDSLVYFFNTQIAQQFFQQEGVDASKLTVIDVDPGNAPPSGPFAALQTQFAAARAQEAAQLGNSPGAALELATDVHTLAAPICVIAARKFFDGIR
jgi:pimeloyl-ACP methyl ester carboxylesterase